MHELNGVCDSTKACTLEDYWLSLISYNICQLQLFLAWGPWSEWSGCSHTCGGGNRLRLKSCLDGDFCEGNITDYEECNTQEFPSSKHYYWNNYHKNHFWLRSWWDVGCIDDKKLFIWESRNFEVHLQRDCKSLIFYCRMGGVEHLQ